MFLYWLIDMGREPLSLTEPARTDPPRLSDFDKRRGR